MHESKNTTKTSHNQNPVIPFHFGSHEIRTIIINNEPHWVGKDVAPALGYANTADAIKRHCKGVAKRYPLSTPGGIQEVRVIREPDLYRLIVGSHLPEAEKFEAWIFEDVLPKIRKTGQYSSKANENYISGLEFDRDQLRKCRTTMKEMQKVLLSSVPYWYKISKGKQACFTNKEIGRMIGKSPSFVKRNIRKMETVGIVPRSFDIQLAIARAEERSKGIVQGSKGASDAELREVSHG